jgi:CDP-diacylglycerol--serine O-phosphatidyltransferase
MLSKFKRNKHQQHLAQLPKISQSVDDVEFFYAPAHFGRRFWKRLPAPRRRICIVALYLEQDEGGRGILHALYEAKRQRPNWMFASWWTGIALSVAVLAPPPQHQCRLVLPDGQENPGVDIRLWRAVNTREALGVLHFKGFIIDDSVLYSGASLNDVYLHQLDKYRYDRYQ